MILQLNIIDETENSTVSELLHDGLRVCFIIEDGYREEKVPGETRIPGGMYPVVKRTEGGFYNRYKERFGHTFVPHIIGVPNYTWILFHIGNRVHETRGCLLTNTYYWRAGDGNYWGKNSKDAYLDLYALLEPVFERGEDVTLIVNREYPEPPQDEEPEPPQPEPPAEEPKEEPPVVEPPTNNPEINPPQGGFCGPAVAFFIALTLLTLAL